MKVQVLNSSKLSPYDDSLAFMTKRVDDIINQTEPELLWFLEHPPLYTAGTSAKQQDLLDSSLPVFTTGRGGQYTYHGPGQRVVYTLLSIARYKKDVHLFVRLLETWLIKALNTLDVDAFSVFGRVGVWVLHNGQEKKIAALGIRLKKWVSFHGVSLNISPDLENFNGIVPCGLSQFGVTSLKELGKTTCFKTVDEALIKAAREVLNLDLHL